MTVLIDMQFSNQWVRPCRIYDPDKLAIVMDHAVPAPTIRDAAGGPHARKVRRRLWHRTLLTMLAARHLPSGHRRERVGAPRRKYWPAPTLTPARRRIQHRRPRIRAGEIYSIMCTGSTWFQIAPTIRYELEGVKPPLVSGKDIFLYIGFPQARFRRIRVGVGRVA